MKNMSLLSYLKKEKHQISKKNNPNTKETNKSNNSNQDKIEIVIENNNNLFENETEMIKNGTSILLENKKVDSLEEGIIVFATMFRGLKYKKLKKKKREK